MSNHLVAQLAETRSGNTRANVLEELRRLILSGSVPPGTQIPPAEVAYAFAVSAIPVREALKTLIGEGLVDHRPHGGYNVSLLSVEELHEICFVRGVLRRPRSPAPSTRPPTTTSPAPAGITSNC